MCLSEGRQRCETTTGHQPEVHGDEAGDSLGADMLLLEDSRIRASQDHETSKETGRTMVLWLVHGTSLVRCAPQHVRPAVEDANVQVAHNPGAALKALEDLKARSTTQFRDMLSKQKGARDMVMEEIMDEEYEEDEFQHPVNRGKAC